MNYMRRLQPSCTALPRPANGFALTTCLLLLTVFAILAVAGFTAALIEQRIAANLEQRERAFQAAEYGIEQALQTPDLSTALTLATPRVMPGSGLFTTLPDSSADAYAYRLYLADVTPSGLLPPDPASALTAFHFIIEATGRGARGAASTHMQSFKVLRDAGWTGGPANASCDPANATCVTPPVPLPIRTSWVEAEAE